MTRPPRPGFNLLRRCALGLWLCGIALLGVVEFRRAAFVTDALVVMSTSAWLWLGGSTLTGLVGVFLLARELLRYRRSKGRGAAASRIPRR